MAVGVNPEMAFPLKLVDTYTNLCGPHPIGFALGHNYPFGGGKESKG